MTSDKDTSQEHFTQFPGDFDLQHPDFGHEERFMAKLETLNGTAYKKISLLRYYSYAAAVAAVFIIGILGFTFFSDGSSTSELSSVSPQLSQTQDFFTNAITSELNKINDLKTPKTEKVINDAMNQLSKLEAQYESLKLNLKESGQDQRVVYAMITNFQNRIHILEQVLNTINEQQNHNTNFHQNSL